MIAGIFLLLAAFAAAAMVWTRLQADTDHLTFDETLKAIEQNTLWFSWHGTARIFFGALLIAAVAVLRPAMMAVQGPALRISTLLLTFGGIAMIVSGVLVIFVSSVYWTNSFDVESYYNYRGSVGSIGNTLIGSAVVLMAPAQWRLGGMMRWMAVLAPFVGVGMILVWVDSATILHRISGAGFGIWLIATAIVLISGAFGPDGGDHELGSSDNVSQISD